jgi:hypothetical protein
MTADPAAQGTPRYGVVTCGKPMPGPMDLGPCRLEPGHEPEPCRWKFAGGYVSISAEPYDSATDPIVQRYRRLTRRSFRIAFACAALNLATALWSIFHLLT